MKILILKNALACGQRFVAGDTVEVSEKMADILIGAKLAKAVELSADGAGETAADKPKRGRGRNREGAQK